jgi:hypothetical protein
MAQRQNKPAACFAGVIVPNLEWHSIFQSVTSLSEISGSKELAIKNAENCLFEASQIVANSLPREF